MIVNVIHLKDAKDHDMRYENIMKQKEFHNLDILIHDGVRASKPKIGINAAHKKVVQYAKDTNQNEILIAEDDFNLTGYGAMDHFLKTIPTDYDIYLGGALQTIKKNGNQIYSFTGMHFALVHHRFYSQFLSANPQMDIDCALAGLGKYVLCQPMIATQIPSYSEHHKSHKDYSKYLKGKAIFSG